MMNHLPSLIRRGEVSSYDLQGPWKAQTYLLILFYFCITYQNVNNQVVDAKKKIVPEWQRKPLPLDMRDDLRVRFEKAYAGVREEGEPAHNDSLKLLKILESMPGWDSAGEDGAGDDDSDDQARGFFPFLHDARTEAEEKGLWPLDIYTVHQLKYKIGAGQILVDKSDDNNSFLALLMAQMHATNRHVIR